MVIRGSLVRFRLVRVRVLFSHLFKRIHIIVLYNVVPVAQWIARSTSNRKVVGSSPIGEKSLDARVGPRGST